MAESGCLRDVAVQNLEVLGNSKFESAVEAPNVHDRSKRILLEEYFHQRPALNAVLNTALANADATHVSNGVIRLAEKVANRNFEVLGSNMTTALATFSANGGITLTTAGADEDQAIVLPHLDTNQTAWSGINWGTADSTEWECVIRTSAAIDNQKIWAGLKLTNDQLIATDNDQAYFKFQTDADNSETFTDFTLLHFVHSIGGTDYVSALPITVAVSTNYHLKISINSSRQAAIFVNGTQYNVTSTAGAAGTAVTAGTDRTAALTDTDNLIPYAGIETGDGNAAAIDVAYVSMSRLL